MGRPRTENIANEPGVALGQLIQSLRLERGISRSVLAQTSGVSINTVMKLEQGKVGDPGVFRVNALARALQMHLDELVGSVLSRHTSGALMTAGIVSIGYEGRELEDFVDELAARGVSTLVDVRLTPLSRKRGFSKNKLREALANVGVAYRHERALGNPKENRDGFRADEPAAITRYEKILGEEDSRASLRAIEDLAKSEVVAVLCFEKDHADCHRRLVIGAMDTKQIELA